MTTTESCSLRAEFHLSLARALLPPGDVQTHAALTTLLSDDLQALAGELDYELTAALSDLSLAMTAAADQERLLRAYSALFLTPPTPVHINTGVYLDGAIAGATVQALETLQLRHGVGRSEQFRDLSDHASAQLELFAFLLARAAEESAAGNHPQARVLIDDANALRDRTLRRWAPALTDDLRKAIARCPDGRPYLALAALLDAALEQDARRFPDQRAEPVDAAAQAMAREKAALRARYQQVDLDDMRARLAAQGLSTAHLATHDS